MSIQAGARQYDEPKTSATLPLTARHLNPMLPLYVRSRKQRARAPTPVEHQGQLYDIMGVDTTGKLLLRDQRVVHQDVRLENFAGRSAILDDKHWSIISLEATPGPTPMELVPVLRLRNLDHPLHIVTVDQTSMSRVRILGRDGEYKPGRIKHGIMRLVPIVAKTHKRVRLRPGQQFECRLRRRELHGLFVVNVCADGQLVAVGLDNSGQTQPTVIEPTSIAPRYRRVESLDFGGHFDVDTFLFREDQLRNLAANIGCDPHGGPIQDPLFGILATGGTMPELTNGADHLAVFERFIRDHTSPSKTYTATAGSPRRLTILNLSMSNQGDARCVIDALVEFRRQNQSAQICIVVSKLGPTEFQESPEFGKYINLLAKHQIDVNDYTNTDERTRQVMHGKAIVIDDHVLFSTGAVMDTRPINKADFSLKLPRPAAMAFRRYVDETIYGDATHERRAELAVQLASLGVVINDPVAQLTYVSRAHDALIRGARHDLIISLSELVDPSITRLLIRRAASGINVTIQVRELDSASAQLLANFTKYCPHLRLEDSSWWEPRPHWNAIIADGTIAYVGSSYLWSTQRNMIHQGRSFENGVLLDEQATKRVCGLITDLRCRNMAVAASDVSKLWISQYRLGLNDELLYMENILKSIAHSFPPVDTSFECAPEENTNDLVVDCTGRHLMQLAVIFLYTRKKADTHSLEISSRQLNIHA